MSAILCPEHAAKTGEWSDRYCPACRVWVLETGISLHIAECLDKLNRGEWDLGEHSASIDAWIKQMESLRAMIAIPK